MNGRDGSTLTFLFCDIEGSTRLIQARPDDYPRLLADVRIIVRRAVEAAGGRVFGTEGDAIFAAFGAAAPAVVAAAEAQRGLAGHAWPAGVTLRMRMGIHSGEARALGDDYVGLSLHETARVMSAGHGGQVLVSRSTRHLAGDNLPAGVGLRDLGEHRLKDLSLPERLYQLLGDGLPDQFPALRTLTSRPNNLPTQLTSFVGRDELAGAGRALAGTRLLTLTGPGGTGKTRLALQLAAEASDDFPDGVFFVALEAVREPGLVPASIAAALGLSSASGGTPEQRLIEHLRDRQLLLVLDNFEQVVAAGPFVTHLLREAPQVKVVVTSRIVLRVYGEHEFGVPPLNLPASPAAGRVSTEVAARSEAVRLFVERAMASQPAFELTDVNASAVIDIVSRLDGLPLAIELAAARVRSLPVEAIRGRLDQSLKLLTGGARDLPGRQQTLRGAIDWSYDLLGATERRLFARFAIFAAGAFLAQAEQVCGGGELGLDVLDGLTALAEESLLRSAMDTDEPRFAMLATIREYGLEKLAEAGELDDLRRRHAIAYLAVVEGCAAALTGAQAKHWLDRLELDHDNVRTALDWAVAAGEPGIALRLLAGIWRFWQVRGHLHEGGERAKVVAAMAGVEDVEPLVRSAGLGAAGSIYYWLGAYEVANGHYLRALAAARESGDQRTIAGALYNLGFAALDVPAPTQDERYRAGRPAYEESLEIFRQLRDEKGIADVSWALAMSHAAEADVAAAEALGGASLDAYRRLDEPFGIGWGAHMLLIYKMVLGKLDEADGLGREAMAAFERSNDLAGLVLVVYDFALLARRLGQSERYWRLAGAVDAMRRQLGVGVLDTSFNLVEWELSPEPPADPIFRAAWMEGASMNLEQAVRVATGAGAAEPISPG